MYKLPERRGGGGGRGNSGNARKKTFFFQEVFPKWVGWDGFLDEVQQRAPHGANSLTDD